MLCTNHTRLRACFWIWDKKETKSKHTAFWNTKFMPGSICWWWCWGGVTGRVPTYYCVIPNSSWGSVGLSKCLVLYTVIFDLNSSEDCISNLAKYLYFRQLVHGQDIDGKACAYCTVGPAYIIYIMYLPHTVNTPPIEKPTEPKMSV